MKQIQGVIFDMDGLMLDTEKLLIRFWMQAAQEAGFAMTLEHVLGIRSLSAVYAEPRLKGIFGENFDYQGIRARRRELTAEYIAAHGIEKKPGLDELLEYLSRNHYRAAVATATARPQAEAYLKQVGVYQYFSAFVCGDMVTKGKPDPEIYQKSSAALGLAPEQCLALEDSPNGILSAHRAGCRPVMIPDLTQPDPELHQILYACVPSLADVIQILKGV